MMNRHTTSPRPAFYSGTEPEATGRLRVGGGSFRYEAMLTPDGRVLSLLEHIAGGVTRPIGPETAEGVCILAAGRDIVYRFDDEQRLRNLAYSDVLEAMRQELHLTLHKVGHGELLDEPELVPLLRRLLRDLEVTAAAFQQARVRLGTEA